MEGLSGLQDEHTEDGWVQSYDVPVPGLQYAFLLRMRRVYRSFDKEGRVAEGHLAALSKVRIHPSEYSRQRNASMSGHCRQETKILSVQYGSVLI